MTSLGSYIKINNWFDVNQKTSIAYGNRLIESNFPCDEPDTKVWDPLNNILPQQNQNTIYFLTAVSQETSEIRIISWPKKENPLTQTDLLDSEEDQTQELIFRIRLSRSIRNPEIIANRLLTLFDDAKEEDPTSVGIEVESLHNFYNFLHLHTNLKCPIISLTPDDDIYASWREDQKQVFSVHFLPDENVRFVIFKPNDKHPERMIRLSGTATTDTLKEIVASSGVWDWISDER